MRRRSFLAAGCAVIVGLAGCGGSGKVLRVRDVEGISRSAVFEDVEVDADSGMNVHLTERATVQLDVRALEAVKICGDVGEPSTSVEVIGSGRQTVHFKLGCSGYDRIEVTVIATRSMGGFVDDFSMVLEYVTPTASPQTE